MIGDWIEGTIKLKEKSMMDAVFELKDYFSPFGLSWDELDHGFNGYIKSAQVGHSIKVLWHPARVDMGVHVSIPSSGVAELGVSFESICRDLFSLGMVGSRFDCAGDDHEGLINLDRVIQAARDKCFVSRWRESGRGGRWELRENEHGGRTLCFGKRESRAFLRIYDKRQEQLDKGKPVEWDIWNRAELELHGERANAAFVYVVTHPDDWHEAACGWMRSYLDFKEPGTNEQKTRWETASWWLEFLKNAAKCRLVVLPVVKTVERVKRWFKRQVVPNAYVLYRYMGMDELISMMLEGQDRVKEKHQLMLSAVGIEL